MLKRISVLLIHGFDDQDVGHQLSTNNAEQENKPLMFEIKPPWPSSGRPSFDATTFLCIPCVPYVWISPTHRQPSPFKETYWEDAQRIRLAKEKGTAKVLSHQDAVRMEDGNDEDGRVADGELLWAVHAKWFWSTQQPHNGILQWCDSCKISVIFVAKTILTSPINVSVPLFFYNFQALCTFFTMLKIKIRVFHVAYCFFPQWRYSIILFNVIRIYWKACAVPIWSTHMVSGFFSVRRMLETVNSALCLKIAYTAKNVIK